MSRPAATPGASPVALVVALAIERRALERRVGQRAREARSDLPAVAGTLGGRPVLVVQAGLGAGRARDAALHLASRVACAAVWSLGLAGGLDPALGAGDLILPDAVVDPEGRMLGCAAPEALRRALEPLSVRAGRLASVASPLLTPADKRSLFAATGAVAADMEAAGIAAAAGILGIPWLALKAVLDPADLAVPPFLLACAGPEGGLRLRAVLGLCRPGGLRAAGRFARLSRSALRRLAEGAERAVRAWGRLDATGAVQ